MRIVLPQSRHDLSTLPQWVEAHQALKTVGLNHQLHIVVPQTIESEAQDAKAALLGLFESVTIWPMDTEPMGGWPFAPNMHFWACANAMLRDNKALPWQLVEPDCLPIKANAYDVIAAKYASCGAPFFGNVSNTPWRTDAGKITKSLYGDSDVMMSGCAVYPGNLLERPNLAGMMADFMKGESSIDVPWDMHLRAAMQADGMAHTELIGQYWNTENYRIENGRLCCDSRKDHEIFKQHPEWERRECGGYVNQEAVMVHGCKDDSLFRLVVGGGIPETYALPPIVQQSQSATISSAPPAVAVTKSMTDERIDKLEGMMGQILEALKSPKTSVGPNATQGEPALGVSASSPHETKAPADILAKVDEALKDKQLRLFELSKTIGVDASVVREAIKSSDRFTMTSKPAEWVKRRAA